MFLYPFPLLSSHRQPWVEVTWCEKGKGGLQVIPFWWAVSLLPSTWEGKEKTLTLINVYCPHADPGKPERLTFKMRFYRLLQIRAEALLAAGRYCKPVQQGFLELVLGAQSCVRTHWEGCGIFVFWIHSQPICRHQHAQGNRLCCLRACEDQIKWYRYEFCTQIPLVTYPGFSFYSLWAQKLVLPLFSLL